MPGMEESLKEMIDKIWEEGRALGLSDNEIIQRIESSIQERITRRPKTNYTPMTDEEIRASQEKINTTTTSTVEYHEVKMPQPLYAPPERVVYEVSREPQPLYAPPEREEYHEVIMPQPLYAPPEVEMQEMFAEEPPETGDTPKKI